jgi:hypothetical protein
MAKTALAGLVHESPVGEADALLFEINRSG